MCEYNVQMLLGTPGRGKDTDSEKMPSIHEVTTVEQMNYLAIHHRKRRKDGGIQTD